MYDEILYLEASGNYVTFVLKDKNILSRSTFLEAANLLPSGKFVRTHRSYLVAINKIDKIEKYQLTINNKTVPVSEGYIGDIAAALRK